jgi:hypothetical protein
VVWNIFPYIGNNHPNWLPYFFFRGVETTNHYVCVYITFDLQRSVPITRIFFFLAAQRHLFHALLSSRRVVIIWTSRGVSQQP